MPAPTVDDRLDELGLDLPEPFTAPAGAVFRFERVRVHGGLAYVSGHGPIDGTRTLVSGRVGDEVDVERGAEAARLTALSILASLRAELGDLDRVESWVRAFGMVNVAPGFNAMPVVVNGFSATVLDVWGEEAGAHARSAVGVASLPFDWPVEVEAVVAIRP